MRLSDTRFLPAPPGHAWSALTDLDVLCDALPGCELLVQIADDEFVGEMAVPLGLVTSRFTVHVLRRDVVAQQGCTLHFQTRTAGTGGAGQAALRLHPEGADATRLQVDVTVAIDGVAAQLGAPLIELAARQLLAQFLARLGAAAQARMP